MSGTPVDTTGIGFALLVAAVYLVPFALFVRGVFQASHRT